MNLKTHLILLLSSLPCIMYAQDVRGSWDLRRCIDYALDNNIQIRMQDIAVENAEASLEQSRAALYPTLNFSAGSSLSFQNMASVNEYLESSGKSTMSGNMGLNSVFTLYQGGKLRKAIEQAGIECQAAGLDAEQAMMDIEISVAQAYFQVLYNKENLDLSRLAAELSNAQLERGAKLLEAGSISPAEFAQLKSQHASDKYQVVAAENALSTVTLQLKQLLELDIDDPFEVEFPEVGDDEVFALTPGLAEVYDHALENLPQMLSSELGVQSSSLSLEMAKSSALPSISMNAGLSTGMYSGTETAMLQQLTDKVSESVGLNLSISIFNGRQVRTNVRKARLQYDNSQLQQMSARKQLLSTLESLCNDAAAAKEKYDASREQLEAAKASYDLVSAQFAAGLKNVVELTSEKNNYTSALSQLLQAKYQAVLATKLLKRYMNEPITL